MTVVAVNQDDLEGLLVATTGAFERALSAVLDADSHAAREVLHTSAARRCARARAMEDLRIRTAVPMPRLFHELQLAADIGQVSELVDQLARHILRGGDSVVLTAAQLTHVQALHDAGCRRLHDLHADPDLDPQYLCCGNTLRAVTERCSHGCSATLALCAALASALLDASRHAGQVLGQQVAHDTFAAR